MGFIQQAADLVDLGEQRLRCVAKPVVGEGRRVDCVERAGAHRLVHAPRVRADAARHDENGAGRLGHDAAGRFDTVELRHDQVHQHDIGRLRDAEVDGLGTVSGHP